MLKVLIADDEPNIREGLIHLINWNDYGFVIAGAVSNGVEALDFRACPESFCVRVCKMFFRPLRPKIRSRNLFTSSNFGV